MGHLKEKGGRNIWREAFLLALSRRRLWPASLLLAVGLSESWRILFDWGPEEIGERVAGWVRGGGGRGFPDTAALVLAGLVVFLALRAIGYLGETVLVRQVEGITEMEGMASVVRAGGTGRAGVKVPLGEAEMAGGEARRCRVDEVECMRRTKENAVPSFGKAFSVCHRRYPALAAVLLPWDAARFLLFSLPSLVVLLWGKWDPRLRFLVLYLLVFLLWFLALFFAYLLLGITTTLAARYVVVNGRKPVEAWRNGWSLLWENASRCLMVWLEVLALELVFLAIAWPLSALLPWLAGLSLEAFPHSVPGWILWALCWILLVMFLVVGQSLVSCFTSTLWTLTFLSLEEAGEMEPDFPLVAGPSRFPDPSSQSRKGMNGHPSLVKRGWRILKPL